MDSEDSFDLENQSLDCLTQPDLCSVRCKTWCPKRKSFLVQGDLTTHQLVRQQFRVGQEYHSDFPELLLENQCCYSGSRTLKGKWRTWLCNHRRLGACAF